MQKYEVGNNVIYYHKGDLPSDIKFKGSVAVDTETTGLSYLRDRICVVQLSAGDGNAHVIQIDRKNPECPNIIKLMKDKNILKIFHFARFDIAMLKLTLGVDTYPVYCTKIASRLARTSSPHHNLKTLVNEFAGNDISKKQQTSDWAVDELSENQVEYAASDVLYLHKIKTELDKMLKRESRFELVKACFEFLPARAELDMLGWGEQDVFAHES